MLSRYGVSDYHVIAISLNFRWGHDSTSFQNENSCIGRASRGFGYPPKNSACHPIPKIGAVAPNPTKNYETRYRTIADKNTIKNESRRERDKKISFWATDVERRKIKKIIAKSGLSQREYLLGAALGRTIYQVNELKPVLAELKAVGRNLNQLTVLSHQGKITAVNLTEAVSTLQKIYAAINVLYDICDGVIASGTEADNDGDL